MYRRKGYISKRRAYSGSRKFSSRKYAKRSMGRNSPNLMATLAPMIAGGVKYLYSRYQARKIVKGGLKPKSRPKYTLIAKK